MSANLALTLIGLVTFLGFGAICAFVAEGKAYRDGYKNGWNNGFTTGKKERAK